MATVREADTALWLHNKLSSDDLWGGGNIWSFFTRDVLNNIQKCFMGLENQVKIKLLTSFLHVPRRTAVELSQEFMEILQTAAEDEDEWVRTLADILKYYPAEGVLNVDLEDVNPVFAEVAHEIRGAS